MLLIEEFLVWLSLRLVDIHQLNSFLGTARNTAVILGTLIAICGGILGSFLLLRGMALTSDAISHTVLLGIVVAFMIMAAFGGTPDSSSPWLLIGAAGAGVGTVLLTELLQRTGLVREDASLGLVFPLLFAVAVIFVSRYVDDVHLDEDAVMVGEIGLAWANTNAWPADGFETIVITEDDPRAEFARRCVNCRQEGISPRDDGAVFIEVCTNCGEYDAAAAYRAGFIDEEPDLLFWPKSLTVMIVLTLATLIFGLLFFKELKISTFDPALARSLGFNPTLMLYLLMALVSLVAVGAFEAVGSILVIGFFIIPAATAYLLTDRLGVMISLSALIGSLSAYLGYDFARGRVFGIDLGRLTGGTWDSSISASMVVVMTIIFILVLLVSPGYGLMSGIIKRRTQRREFEEQVILGHIFHHSGSPEAARELEVGELNRHVQWAEGRLDTVLGRVIQSGLVVVDSAGLYSLTPRGREAVEKFWHRNLARKYPPRKHNLPDESKLSSRLKT